VGILDAGFISFDLETTGVDPETARIVTAAALTLDRDGHVGTKTWLIDPGVDIPEEATAVHGVTTAMAREGGEDSGKAVRAIAAHIAQTKILVIYNAPYDLTVLDRELRRHGYTELCDISESPSVVDPLVMDKALDRYRKGSRKLVDVCTHYGIDVGEAHEASADALGAARLAWKLVAVLAEEFGVTTAGVLHTMQAGWYAQQQETFAQYLRKKALELPLGERGELLEKAVGVTKDWPIKPFPTP
jgi:DNA polymerase III subunit epsilon